MFPTNFLLNDYKKHRENILFEREKCLLPETQLEIDRRKKLAEVLKQVRDIKHNKNKLKTEKQNLKNGTSDSKAIVKKINQTIHIYNQKLRELRVELRILANGNAQREQKVVVTRKCPTEDCRGFLGKDWSCSLCETTVCCDCHQVKDTDNHTCKTEDVETAKLLSKDSKNCPSCNSLIFKISGCDQMWCTQCHTAFKWSTLQIEKGVIHNPHYYEYQRRMNGGVAPRVPGDNPDDGLCDAIPQLIVCLAEWKKMEYSVKDINYFTQIHWMVMHIRFGIRDPEIPNNMDFRIRYLNNEITESEFKIKIQRREKNYNKVNEEHQVLNMFATCCLDIIRMSITNYNCEAITELQKLCSYFNETMINISKVYKCITYRILYKNGIPLLTKV
jgi:hypothetical protein